MAKYRKNFELNLKDMDLIEEALRRQVALSTIQTDTVSDRHDPAKLMDIQSLLGKLHEQKIFYSQVNISNHPRG